LLIYCYYTPDDGSVRAETCRVDLIKSYILRMVVIIFIINYLFCIMRKFVQCGKYFRPHAVPPYTSFTV
jgi:hypothetical protein